MSDTSASDWQPKLAHSYSWAILRGLQRLPHVYGGTVSDDEKKHRRATNRRARVARRANRR